MITVIKIGIAIDTARIAVIVERFESSCGFSPRLKSRSTMNMKYQVMLDAKAMVTARNIAKMTMRIRRRRAWAL